MKSEFSYGAKLAMPVSTLGIRIADQRLWGIDFLPPTESTLAPQDALSREICAQLQAYLADPCFIFDLPLTLLGTSYQLRVWQALRQIPVGEVTTYGELAQTLDSGPRAVGQACGANPLPIIVPCHRVVAKGGRGGFMHHASGAPLRIKDWLLQHEAQPH